MAATNKTLIDGVLAGLTAAVAYTSPAVGLGTRITAFTVTNTDGASAMTYKVYIVPAAGTAGFANVLVNGATLTAIEDDTPAAVINQLVPAGGTIEILASSGSTVAFRASGIEFT